ncbi:MAG: hypothetical protein A2790_05205 [Phenylobacterium sp. RIFCSPHIGHO2_01_FULL_69_31]|jgi:hypothetical protein|uniref:hypothetical protein n=1 Tax=Phenylobacterium sp. RIFCSPHIGHO2_01_FULL_69_31 TaxID=1801944 RepID=UPI0008CF591B|nr:hypothetical protein [Phenylobacterium sp. RIFCSPHIGHO2_01_FULL_69_31]OHB30211.1 MAG: hypothetical protein A2790_05205 [Phenylobacterium sp. RIFCSPHIGHO2_01_FULL_69_31]
MIVKKLKLAALAATVALAGCATGSAPSKAPPPKKGPYIGIDGGLASRASAFEAFTRKATAIDASFSGPGQIAERLRTAAGYEPKELEAGMIAYAALAAMQEPAFVAGVRAKGRDVSRRLATDPAAALDLPGGQAAAQRANAALARRGEALADAGARVKKTSYSIQHQAWSRARLTNGPQRLAAVKQAAGYRPEAADRARLTAAISEGGRRGGPSPVVARGVALAALTVLGQDAAARPLLSEFKSGQCLRTAKLNYHQCLAAAGTHYEDIYCLGVHAMRDPGQCVVDATKPAKTMRRASLD